MPIGERKSRGAVVELHLQPTVRRVAQIAGGRETCAGVVGVGSFLKVPQVARSTRGREAFILAHGSAFVTLLARDSRVRAEKGKAVLVILNLLRGNLPTEYGVTLCAVRAHFAAVNIGVTILAVFPDVREHGFDMTLRALHFFVHAAKKVFRFVVIEFRDGANRAPPRGGMAILARYGQRSMRAARALLLRLGARRHRRLREGESEPAQNLDKRVVYNHPVSSTLRKEGGNPITLLSVFRNHQP